MCLLTIPVMQRISSQPFLTANQRRPRANNRKQDLVHSWFGIQFGELHLWIDTMSETLPIALAVYPLLLSGIALIWLLRRQHQSWPQYVMWVLACGSFLAFAFMTGSWAFTSYYLRYIVLGLFVAIVVFSWLRTRWSGVSSQGNITTPSLLLLFFTFLDAVVIAAHFPSANTVALTFPLNSGTYYVLQGGRNIFTNPFHVRGSNSLAIDIVKLNTLGNRATSIAPRELTAYEIFGDTLYSPCQGNVVTVTDGLPDNPPGHPDTRHPQGNYIVLRCADAEILVCHLRQGSTKVIPGETVNVNKPLAEIGNSGNSLEPHLHIEARDNDSAVEPLFDGRPLLINSVLVSKG